MFHVKQSPNSPPIFMVSYAVLICHYSRLGQAKHAGTGWTLWQKSHLAQPSAMLHLQPPLVTQKRHALPAPPVPPTRYRLFIPVIEYCAKMGSLAIMAPAAICLQHIRRIYNEKRFSLTMKDSNLIGERQKMPDLAVHLVKEIIIAL
jgi:hypothetical protein